MVLRIDLPNQDELIYEERAVEEEGGQLQILTLAIFPAVASQLSHRPPWHRPPLPSSIFPLSQSHTKAEVGKSSSRRDGAHALFSRCDAAVVASIDIGGSLKNRINLLTAVIGKAQGFYSASSLDGSSQTILLTVLTILVHGS
ncbi:hypothetical protein JHK86_020593 [Glycine max]|nr:hypothetical protein JHK86_020593 [Glycine max]